MNSLFSRAAALAAGAVLALLAPTIAFADDAAPSAAPSAGDESPAVVGEEAALAKELANPVAALISVPFQTNFESQIGPLREGNRTTINIQPVVPISLNSDWNLISRTIVPVVTQSNIAPGAGNQFGLSDTVQSLFLSPAKGGGVTWGVGPAILLPTGTNTLLTAGKWGVGPTAVVLSQFNGWTVGALVNHIWSFAGDGGRASVNQSFFQPFVTYTTKKATSYGLQTEGTYDWGNSKLTVPVIATLGQVTKVGPQLVSFTLGLKYFVATTANSPHGFGGRFSVVLLYPRK